jgi:hypothetical protein
MRGKDEGRYPFHYLEMIDNLFGEEKTRLKFAVVRFKMFIPLT